MPIIPLNALVVLLTTPPQFPSHPSGRLENNVN
jgi:hypothetical protein